MNHDLKSSEYNHIMNIAQLEKQAYDLFQLHLSGHQLEQLQRYEALLQEWNQKFNLTAISDPEGVQQKHFLDSISTVMVLKNYQLENLIDVGTGAGFPGLVIKILLPEIELTLVESVGKKVEFCRIVAETLGLSNVNLINERAELMGRDANHREQYSAAIARAVASMPILCEYLLPFVKRDGVMLAQKGESGPAETQLAENAIQILGGKVSYIHHITLPGVVEERYLIEVNKIAPTPEKYPRRVGIPTKRPL